MLAPVGSGVVQTVLHRFQGPDGSNPASEVTIDGDSLYGTTFSGGSNDLGTVFRLARTSSGFSFTKIFDFTGAASGGESPTSGVLALGGTLYGATVLKGCYCSIIYALQPSSSGYRESLVATLQGKLGDYTPATPTASEQSMLAVNSQGGLHRKACPYGCGTAFEIVGGYPTLVHTFAGTRYDGAFPYSRLWRDAAGDLFGTSLHGGGNTKACKAGGCGVVFELSASSSGYSESIVYRFTGKVDGRGPNAVVGDSTGRLFGTTNTTIFELKRARHAYRETTLHTFAENGDPTYPAGQVAISNGTLYGALSQGGKSRCTEGCGAIYKLSLPAQ